MGPAFFTRDITDGLKWSPMGPALPAEYVVDDLQWAQYDWEVNVPMAFNGPSILHKGYYRWTQMGPALPVEYLADDHQWAQCCRWNFVDDLQWAQYDWGVNVPMALNGPSILHKGYYRWAQMGPAFPVEYLADDHQWARRCR